MDIQATRTWPDVDRNSRLHHRSGSVGLSASSNDSQDAPSPGSGVRGVVGYARRFRKTKALALRCGPVARLMKRLLVLSLMAVVSTGCSQSNMRSLKCTMEGYEDWVEDTSFIELPIIYTFDIKSGQEYRYNWPNWNKVNLQSNKNII